MNTDVNLEDPALIGTVLKSGGCRRLMIPSERIPHTDWKEICADIHAHGMEAVLALPYILREAGVKWLFERKDALRHAGFDGYLIRNIDTAGLLGEEEIPGRRIFDAGVYTWNSVSAEVMRSLGADELTLPYELTLREMEQRGISDTDTLVAYGRIPLMISAQCTKKNSGNCLKAAAGKERPSRGRKDERGAAVRRRGPSYAGTGFSDGPASRRGAGAERGKAFPVSAAGTGAGGGLPHRHLQQALRQGGVPPSRHTVRLQTGKGSVS